MAAPFFLFPNTPFLPTATVTATDSYSGTDPSYILTATEDRFHRPANTTGSKVYTIDLGGARNLDALGLVGQGMDGILVTIDIDDNASFTSPTNLVTNHNLSAPVNAGWVCFTQSVSRYVRITVSQFGTAFRLAWICPCLATQLPYTKNAPDLLGVQADGTPVVSPEGLLVGTAQNKTMKEVRLDFGLLSNTVYAPLEAWKTQCITTVRPFFYVPDSDLDEVYFGWLKNYDFRAPHQDALKLYRRVEPFTFVTRAR